MAVPVTILCGALGAGKTTLLSHLLEQDDRDIAVVVNDVGEVNVDADLVETRTELESGEELVALENGCICCSLGGDLSRAVVNLWKRHEFDALVVEASGVGEPEPIAHQFVRGPAGGPYDLDAIVTVVNARQFYDTFLADAEGRIRPRKQGSDDEDGVRPLSDLLLEQIEFCDRLVLNKCDLVTDAEREELVAVLETLQPRAEVVTAEYGDLAVDTVLDTGLFDFSVAREAAGWKRAIDDHAVESEVDDHGQRHGDSHEHADGHQHDEKQHADGHQHDEKQHADGHQHDEKQHADGHQHDKKQHTHEHAHPADRYGIVVDTYRRVRPFHPQRFLAFLENPPADLIRMKGLTWIAGRETQAITTSLAATETSLEVTGRWIASFSEQQQSTYRESQPELPWDERWGDRETRLAVIGRQLDREALFDRLDACLVSDDELEAGPDAWSSFENQTPTAMNRTVVVSSADGDAGNE